jgi:hypothetical protein
MPTLVCAISPRSRAKELKFVTSPPTMAEFGTISSSFFRFRGRRWVTISRTWVTSAIMLPIDIRSPTRKARR